MNNKYSVSDVMSSQEPEEIEVPFKDGVVELRITPLTYGELQLLMKKSNTEPGERNLEMSNELFVECVEKKVEDENGNEKWESFTKRDVKDLPPGFSVEVLDRVNEKLGLTAPAENFRKSLMTR